MARLIEQFASTLGASQRANITTLLEEGNIRGEIKSFDDFKARLAELSLDINLEATPITSILKVLADRLITSSSYNGMVRAIRLDLETVYTEVDNIAKLVDTHRAIQEKKIEDINNALASLDTDISTFELLSNDIDYGKAQFNTFNTIGAKAYSKLSQYASSLYYDARLLKSLTAVTYEASVDSTREGLILPIDQSNSRVIHSISVEEGSLTTESDLDINPDNNELKNILVDRDGKYWIRSVLIFDSDNYGAHVEPLSNGALTSVRLDLSGYQEVNSIVVSPFTDSAYYIDSIVYNDVDGGDFYILSTPTQISERTTFTFSRVVTNRITLNLRQPSYSEVSDFYWNNVADNVSYLDSTAATSGIGATRFVSPNTLQHSRGYLYTVGFDYIGIFNSNYREMGVYVSEALTSDTLVTELSVNASTELSYDDSSNPQDSLEFYIAKYNYDSSGLLVRKEFFPVTYESGSITHEALVLSSSVGQTRLFPDYNSLVVYQDFSALVLGTDYTLSVDGGQNFRSSIATLSSDAVSGVPQKLLIKILDSKVNSTYTVSYTPVTTINAGHVYLDGAGYVEFNGRTVKFNYAPDTAIASCEIYTIIFLRSLNYTVSRETPIIFDYSTKIAEVNSAVQ